MPPNVVQTYEVIVQVNYSFNSNLKQCTMYQIYYPFFATLIVMLIYFQCGHGAPFHRVKLIILL